MTATTTTELSPKELNNVLIRLRKDVKKASIFVARKLKHHIERHKKSTDPKMQRRIERYVAEIRETRKFASNVGSDEVSKFALVNVKKLEELNVTSEMPVHTATLYKVATWNTMQRAIDEIRKKYPNWHQEIPFLLQRFGQQSQQKKAEYKAAKTAKAADKGVKTPVTVDKAVKTPITAKKSAKTPVAADKAAKTPVKFSAKKAKKEEKLARSEDSDEEIDDNEEDALKAKLLAGLKTKTPKAMKAETPKSTPSKTVAKAKKSAVICEPEQDEEDDENDDEVEEEDSDNDQDKDDDKEDEGKVSNAEEEESEDDFWTKKQTSEKQPSEKRQWKSAERPQRSAGRGGRFDTGSERRPPNRPNNRGGSAMRPNSFDQRRREFTPNSSDDRRQSAGGRGRFAQNGGARGGAPGSGGRFAQNGGGARGGAPGSGGRFAQNGGAPGSGGRFARGGAPPSTAEKLHPSWEAAKRRNEQMKTAFSSGGAGGSSAKRIKFDD